jgi:hypothetical protein
MAPERFSGLVMFVAPVEVFAAVVVGQRQEVMAFCVRLVGDGAKLTVASFYNECRNLQMWTYILGPFLALLPKCWRKWVPFLDLPRWRRATILQRIR